MTNNQSHYKLDEDEKESYVSEVYFGVDVAATTIESKDKKDKQDEEK